MTSTFLPLLSGTISLTMTPPKLLISASRPPAPVRVKSCTFSPLAVVPQSAAVMLAAWAGASATRARKAMTERTNMDSPLLSGDRHQPDHHARRGRGQGQAGAGAGRILNEDIKQAVGPGDDIAYPAKLMKQRLLAD